MPNIESEITKSNLKILEESRNQKKNEKTCNGKQRLYAKWKVSALPKVAYTKLLSLIKNCTILNTPQKTSKQDVTNTCTASEIKT